MKDITLCLYLEMWYRLCCISAFQQWIDSQGSYQLGLFWWNLVPCSAVRKCSLHTIWNNHHATKTCYLCSATELLKDDLITESPDGTCYLKLHALIRVLWLDTSNAWEGSLHVFTRRVIFDHVIMISKVRPLVRIRSGRAVVSAQPSTWNYYCFYVNIAPGLYLMFFLCTCI